ncbi:cell division protein FtsK [Streptomyces sp. HB2AG]|uniref:cell division protein FtsK n=1 Tax=Streptomyces sp. HB2AG TaxID=2983400 RepID=UPI0022AAB5F1|nr:cell division protein FtsK [Streptomyces sp. HB2AG]MCZ2525073.1 cell division protein FtsK [Streptomyces sp. HB2AG]
MTETLISSTAPPALNGHASTAPAEAVPLHKPATTPEPPAADFDDREPDGGRPVPVDPADLPGPGITTETRRPIVPGWLRSRVDALATARHVVDRALYAAGYHGLRCPVYAARLAGYAPRGAARLVMRTGRWVWDTEAAPLRAGAVKRDDAEEYLRLSRQRDHRVRARGLVAAVAAVFGAGLALTLYVMAPGWLTVVASAGVLLLGWLGQTKDNPVVGPAVVRTELAKLTADIVLRALGAIGNDKINRALAKGGEGIKFTAPITRDGPGYRADVDLPYGVTAEDVMEKRKALASGLRRKLGCVWPAPDPAEHEGRLVLWVGDRPMNETAKPAWPLAKSGQVDLFRPVVFGNDQRMRDISVTLMFASVVVGSIPRMGKTFLMRLLLLIAALDPRAELHAFDFKGTGDFGALEPVCHRYRAGEEDEDIEYVVASLRELKDELRRRAKVIKSLPRSVCPESKVTSALADDKRHRLHPIVVALDECQVPFEHPEHGAEIEAICTDLVKRGPALGIVAMFGTQRPDAKSLPTGISANAVLRFCLKVMGQPANDMVLGTSMYKAGYRATMFSRSDRGICWMAGEGDEPRIVSSAFVDAPAAERIVLRARKVREEYGNVTGHAVGQEPEKTGPEHDVLADVLAVVAPEEEKVWGERIAARLAELRPDVYAGWEASTVTVALKPHGVKACDVWGTTDDGKGTTRRGFTRADIAAAVTRRDSKRAAN